MKFSAKRLKERSLVPFAFPWKTLGLVLIALALNWYLQCHIAVFGTIK